MKRWIVTALSIVAIAVYSWNIWYFVKPKWERQDSESSTESSVSVILYSIPEPFQFEDVKRSPFESSRPKPKVRKKVKAKPKPKVRKKVKIKPPRVKINGIMWNSSRPLVMLKLPNGTTKMVKEGDELLGQIVVQKIERARVQLLYKEQLFWIDK